ncbi:hypothetical protein HN51_050533 [Arachis hypogaea]|uniref:Phosphoinositide phospholipase C n=1 Tax=Arachis hypogaea TaxID=3818 RepID=A0A444YAT7_ARAHY|nr:phosphoinositide phospholipase C 1-like [Arachis ipaensis]XP_025668946.1 phosphoinositide phospholipase C 1 [Arachis hypogaea]QHN92301.1 Phosphoinositide phospholipase C [Arachis hypogaea]RYQ99058.1 hypothetical protein Ahy_B07g086908 isoform B [Arachis hypogaea]
MGSSGASLGSSSWRKPKHQQHFQVCFCFKRIFKLKVSEPPEEIRSIFEKFSENNNGTVMSVDGLYRFLVRFQGERDCDDTKHKAQAIFDSHKHLFLFQRKGFHLDAFFRYLLGDDNAPLLQVGHDMRSPLAHYFLYTGHNSYLTGNQFSSNSSTAPIIKALKKGVRVIELDLWPNSTGKSVEVRHGGTITSPVKLRACLKAIKEYAFYASKYPVVITFEDHIKPPLQAKVAKMVNGIFGDMLYRPSSEHIMNKFPSPESLKEKILISTKPPETPEEDQEHNEERSSEINYYMIRYNSDDNDENEDEDKDKSEDEENNALEYRDIISIHAGKPKGGSGNLFISHEKVRRLSLSEDQLEEIAKTRATEIVRFTQKNLLRIYPRGTRVDSSNYNPMVGWMHGAQMVAFNMQGHGHLLRMMEGMFRANGGCGYVKKPNILLDENEVFDPSAFRLPKKHLQVMVYMGEGWRSEFSPTHFDLYSPPDFCVELRIYGVPADESTKETMTMEDEWVPVWNQEFIFPLTVPELALLYIKVVEHDFKGKNDFAGETCLPVSELRQGIRSIRLCNKKGEPYKHVRLLMRFQFI